MTNSKMISSKTCMKEICTLRKLGRVQEMVIKNNNKI